MPKVYCGAVDCKWNSVKNQCTKKEIHLADNYVMTVYDGRQHFNRCNEYEMSEENKELLKQFKVVARGTQKDRPNARNVWRGSRA